jgi:hypothetical protein
MDMRKNGPFGGTRFGASSFIGCSAGLAVGAR